MEDESCKNKFWTPYSTLIEHKMKFLYFVVPFCFNYIAQIYRILKVKRLIKETI